MHVLQKYAHFSMQFEEEMIEYDGALRVLKTLQSVKGVNTNEFIPDSTENCDARIMTCTTGMPVFSRDGLQLDSLKQPQIPNHNSQLATKD